MEIRRYLSIVRRHVVLVIAIVAAAIAAGYLITPRDTSYTATSTLYVGSRSIDLDPRSGEVSGDRAAGLDRLISTFTALLESRPQAEAAIEDAEVQRSPSEVEASVDAQQLEATNLVAVTVSDEDPVVAQALTNALAEAFVDEIRELEPRESEEEQVVSVYERARTPTTANSTPLIRNLVLSGLLGLVIAGGTVALLESLDITFRTSEDLERRLELPVLGVVPALGSQLPVTAPAQARKPPERESRRERGTRRA